MRAAEAAIANPLLDETSMRGARGLLVSISGSKDLTLYELDEAASRIREEVDDETNIIVGATFDADLGDAVRVSVVATGIDRAIEIEPMAGRSRAEPAFRPGAEAVLDTIGRVARCDPEVQTQPPPAAAVIPFPDLGERRKGIDEESPEGHQANRHPSMLERLGVTVSERWQARRASGWR